ncbi:hypothetical protein acsn021_27150 [Anaerocolumna cellulosilytica]|uniref:Uncharacterized protein n=1 Tax=Anaerocolumna cellulosilytica TaxID=433286 RepID=A0A6S6QZE7_9FIRM|nr:ATP-grasp domain-containing protein [Anaerocolumna cellulosilytica]MBB5197974.1 RimK family alpha-L-glutamate ligase [Anaerocolumna cellulosilytica]BCJ95146.1 hypothetical protein acsn021_27150 [Anaerocolumna cellulosilytica]
MRAWLIYRRQDAVKNKGYINFYLEEGKTRGITIELLYVEDIEFGIRTGSWYMKYRQKELLLPDFAICRTIYPLLSRHLEYMGIPVFNNSCVAEVCNDKAKTYQYVAKLDIPMVDSAFVSDKDLVNHLWASESKKVVKAVDGHGGSQVMLLPDKKRVSAEEYEAAVKRIVNTMEGASVVVQPLTGTKNQDLRVYVIGKQIIAAILRTAKEGFKSNFSLGGEVCTYFLSKQEEMQIQRIIASFDFGLVGIDFIIGDDGELLFNEIEDVVGARMLYQCTDINLVRLYLQFIIEELQK